jgi:hypothetical protein
MVVTAATLPVAPKFERTLTDREVFALVKQLTPQQAALVTLFLLIEKDPHRDVIVARLQTLMI